MAAVLTIAAAGRRGGADHGPRARRGGRWTRGAGRTEITNKGLA